MPPAQRLTPLQMTERLVGFDTTSRDSNLALIDFVEDYLRGHGAPCTRIASPDGRKANLFATLGPQDQAGGIVLSGHTDVVPVDGQPWRSDPFRLLSRDGRLYGRGTCDMKSFLAVALALVPEFTARRLRIPVHLALSYDEEVGCLGVRPMIEQMIASGPPPALVIVGEPTNMRVVDAHKGICVLRTTVTGLEGHSSAPEKGASAITAAAALIAFLDTMAAQMRSQGDPSGRFDPPHGTMNVGEISGGEAVNIIPRECAFTWEYRPLPDHPGGDAADHFDVAARLDAHARDHVLPALRARSGGVGVETTEIASVPGLCAGSASSAAALVLKLAGRNETGAVSYATEAGLFQQAGVPAFVCGPGDIAQAHTANEFIEQAQVDACEGFLRRLLEHVRA